MPKALADQDLETIRRKLRRQKELYLGEPEKEEKL
jgi:hypothetical protein